MRDMDLKIIDELDKMIPAEPEEEPEQVEEPAPKTVRRSKK